MKLKELRRYAGVQVNMIYLDRQNKITARRILIQSVDDARLRAYCFERRAPRVFMVCRVLAIFPLTEATVQA